MPHDDFYLFRDSRTESCGAVVNADLMLHPHVIRKFSTAKRKHEREEVRLLVGDEG